MKAGIRRSFWIGVSVLLVATLGGGLGACAPYFRRAGHSLSKGGPGGGFFSFLWSRSRLAGSSGIGLAEQGDAAFPQAFPKATFMGSGSDLRVTAAGLVKKGARWPDYFQFDPTIPGLKPSFGVVPGGGIQLFEPPGVFFGGAPREVVDVKLNPSGTLLYTLLVDTQRRCYILRSDVTTGVRDASFLITEKDCDLAPTARAVLVVGSLSIHIVSANASATDWMIRKYSILSQTAVTPFGVAGPGLAAVVHPTLSGTNHSIVGALEASNGNLLVAGQFVTSGVSQLALFQLNATGTVVASFGTLGFVSSELSCVAHCFGYELKEPVPGEYLVGGSSDSRAAIFRVLATNVSGQLDSAYTFSNLPGALDGDARIYRLAVDPSDSDQVHFTGWRAEAGVPKPFHGVFSRVGGGLATASWHAPDGYRRVVSPAPISGASAEWPLAIQPFMAAGQRRVGLLLVSKDSMGTAQFRTVVIGNSSGVVNTDVSVMAALPTQSLHVLSERSYPIGEGVDSSGRVIRASRVVLSGSVAPDNSEADSEISQIVVSRLLSNGTDDPTFAGTGSLVIAEDANGFCRGDTEAFAFDADTGRFFIACQKQTAGFTRSNDMGIRIQSFDSDGSPLTTFGPLGVRTLDASTLDQHEATTSLVGRIYAAAIPDCSALLGGGCSGPGVALAYTSRGGSKWPTLALIKSDGTFASGFGTGGVSEPLTTDETVTALAFSPNLSRVGTSQGIWLGTQSGGGGSPRVTLIGPTGTFVFDAHVPAWTASHRLEQIAVDPSTGNAMATVAAETQTAHFTLLNGADGSTIRDFDTGTFTTSPTMGQFYPRVAHHRSGAFYAGFTYADTVLTQWIIPSGVGAIQPALLKFDLGGNLIQSNTLSLDPSAYSALQTLTVGASGELQAGFLQSDPNGGLIHQTARIQGAAALKP